MRRFTVVRPSPSAGNLREGLRDKTVPECVEFKGRLLVEVSRTQTADFS